MALINIDAEKAARALADEAALKLDPIIQAAIQRLVDELKKVLVGRKITITIE